MFSIRIVTTDHYLSDPIPGLDVTRSDFRGTEVKKVPVLRIFGSTPAGQKTCMHVHGVFPYLYVPYDGTKPADKYQRQFAASLDKALNVGNGMTKTNIQHVFKISLVSGIPMYGYHQKEEQFLKIYLYNPHSIKKAADLLLGGAVMNKSFQPHESHIPYQLQLFIDFNLYGMNMINVAAVKFRKSQHEDEDVDEMDCSPDSLSPDSLIGYSDLNTPSTRRWNHHNIERSLYLAEGVVRHSTCELEVDVVASDILNRLEVNANIGTNPGLTALWEDEKQRRRDLGENSQLVTQESQEHDEVVLSESEQELKLRLLQIVEDQQSFPDSQSEDEESDMSQGDDSGTQTERVVPSSQVQKHRIQRQDSDDLPSSQDTIIVEGGRDEGRDDDSQPIISLESIQKVLLFSQSFSQPTASQTDKGDKSLAEILASLAEESEECSQHDLSQIEDLEDEDSILVTKPRLPTHTSIKEDEEETIQMSQIVVGDDDNDDDEKKVEMGESSKAHEKSEGDAFNLEGMDDSWSASQWFSDDSDEDGNIPQFDGASDKRPVGRPKKRLGPRGPLIPGQLHLPPNNASSAPYSSQHYPHHNPNQSTQHGYHGNGGGYPGNNDGYHSNMDNYHSNNEYQQYNNTWHNDFSVQGSHVSRWEQPSYEAINSPPAYPSSMAPAFFQGYQQRQQQHQPPQQHSAPVYQQTYFSSERSSYSSSEQQHQNRPEDFSPTRILNRPEDFSPSPTLNRQDFSPTRILNRADFSPTTINHNTFASTNQSPVSPPIHTSASFSQSAGSKSALVSGPLTTYEYEAITPPPPQEAPPDSPAATMHLQSPLRSILTNQSYTPSYLNNKRSASRSSLHSASSAGSHHSDPYFSKTEDMSPGNSLHKAKSVASHVHPHQSYLEFSKKDDMSPGNTFHTAKSVASHVNPCQSYPDFSKAEDMSPGNTFHTAKSVATLSTGLHHSDPYFSKKEDMAPGNNTFHTAKSVAHGPHHQNYPEMLTSVNLSTEIDRDREVPNYQHYLNKQSLSHSSMHLTSSSERHHSNVLKSDEILPNSNMFPSVGSVTQHQNYSEILRGEDLLNALDKEPLSYQHTFSDNATFAQVPSSPEHGHQSSPQMSLFKRQSSLLDHHVPISPEPTSPQNIVHHFEQSSAASQPHYTDVHPINYSNDLEIVSSPTPHVRNSSLEDLFSDETSFTSSQNLSTEPLCSPKVDPIYPPKSGDMCSPKAGTQYAPKSGDLCSLKAGPRTEPLYSPLYASKSGDMCSPKAGSLYSLKAVDQNTPKAGTLYTPKAETLYSPKAGPLYSSKAGPLYSPQARDQYSLKPSDQFSPNAGSEYSTKKDKLHLKPKFSTKYHKGRQPSSSVSSIKASGVQPLQDSLSTKYHKEPPPSSSVSSMDSSGLLPFQDSLSTKYHKGRPASSSISSMESSGLLPFQDSLSTKYHKGRPPSSSVSSMDSSGLLPFQDSLSTKYHKGRPASSSASSIDSSNLLPLQDLSPPRQQPPFYPHMRTNQSVPQTHHPKHMSNPDRPAENFGHQLSTVSFPETQKQSQNRNSLEGLLSLVSSVSKDNIIGLSPKKSYIKNMKINQAMQSPSPMQTKSIFEKMQQTLSTNEPPITTITNKPPKTPMVDEQPQYTNLDSWKQNHSKSDLSHTPLTYSELWDKQIQDVVNEEPSTLPKVGKKQRMRKLGLMKPRKVKPAAIEVPKNVAYSFTFQVPTPVFKRLKFRKSPNPTGLKVVRMHPKEARKYSLLKIGREMVKIPKLTAGDVLKVQNLLKFQDSEQEISKITNISEPVPTAAPKKNMEKMLSRLLSEDDPTLKPLEHPAFQAKKVPNRTEENRALKRKSLKLNKKPKLLIAKNPIPFSNLNMDADFSHRILDPDQGDEKMVVLKDVSLRDASEGILTPIKSQTPVSGRSPAYCSTNPEDLYNKGMEELELGAGHKIFGNVLLCDKEPMSEEESVLSNTRSGTSSRMSSRKESSESSESLFEDQEKPAGVGKRRHSSANSQSNTTAERPRRASVTYSPTIFTPLITMEGDSERNVKNHKRKRHKKDREVEGVHYIVVGKFKGHKCMKVKLKRVNCPKKTVSAREFLDNPLKYQNGMVECAAEEPLKVEQIVSSCEVSEDEQEETTEKTRMEKPKEIQVPTYESSDSCNSYDSGLMSRSENLSQNVSENSSEATEMSESLKELKNKTRRKKLTPNQRLGVAFLTTRARRKKTQNGGKLMNSLSILHQATLANLTETTPTYSDDADDHKNNYEDVMFKLALFSPPDSIKGDNSPPVPTSPTLEFKDFVPTASAEELLKEMSPEHKSPEILKVDSEKNYSKPLEIDVKCVKIGVRSQSSIEGIFETPLSSLETGKADPGFSPGLASVGSSEHDFNAGMPELKDETTAMDVDENDDFWKEDRVYKTSQMVKTAVVKETSLSFADISSFNATRNTCSPPDLGPPNIPNCSAGFMSNPQQDRSPTPPNLTPNRSPKGAESDKKEDTNVLKVMKLLAYRPKSSLSLPKKSPDSQQSSPSSGNVETQSEQKSNSLKTENSDPFKTSAKTGSNKKPKRVYKITEPLKKVRTVEKEKERTDLTGEKETLDFNDLSTKAETSSNCDITLRSNSDGKNVNNSETDLNHKVPENSANNFKLLANNRIVSYLSSPDEFVAANSSADKTLLNNPTRNVWTDITCASIDSVGENKPQKYRKKHELYNNNNGLASSVPVSCVPTSGEVASSGPVSSGPMIGGPPSCGLASGESASCGPSNSNKSLGNQDAKSDPPNNETEIAASYAKSLVIKPTSLAPLRSSIIESAKSHGFSLTNHQEAYFSNPDDLPNRSKEVGSRVIKVESNRIQDLPEFQTISESLKNWRTILTAANSDLDDLFSSQERESLWDKLEKDPQFRFVLSEDKAQVIAPCRLPPTKSDVTKWLHQKVKKVMQKEKRENRILDIDEVDTAAANIKIHVSSPVSSPEKCDDGDNDDSVLLYEHVASFVELDTEIDNSVTFHESGARADNSMCLDQDSSLILNESGKDNSLCYVNQGADNSNNVSVYECSTVIEVNQNDLDLTQTNNAVVEDEISLRESDLESNLMTPKTIKVTRLKRTMSDGELMVNSQEDVEILSPPLNPSKKLCSRWDQEQMSPPKNQNLDLGESDSSYLHSTPVRQDKGDLFEPSCTPITVHTDKYLHGDGNPPGMFVTPKRPAPSRRISTNTDKTLRRTILTSQMKSQLLTPDGSKGDTSQIDGPTPKNSFGFKITQQNLQDAKALHQHQYLTVMSIEIHAETRGDYSPNPEIDPIQVIFYSVYNDVPEVEGHRFTTGAIIVDKTSAEEETTPSPKPSRGRKPSGKSRSVSPKPVSSRSPQPSTSKADSQSSPRSRSLSPKPRRGASSPSSSKTSPLKQSVTSSQAKALSSKSPKPSTSKDLSSSKDSSPKPSTSKSKDLCSPKPSTSKSSPPLSPSSRRRKKTLLEKSGVENLVVKYVANEEELLDEFLKLVQSCDPDILVGYEIQLLSLGYILQRAAHLGRNICPSLSRLPASKDGNRFSAEKDTWGANYNTEIHIAGRIVLNLWRVLKHEITLNIYDFENVAYHVLHRRIPLYSFRSLTTWFNHMTHLYRWRVIDHYVVRVKGLLQIIDQLDIIGKTSEFARVFGIEFYDVLSRGSQYRVESMMLRLAKPMNFIPLSPSVHQRARMKAPECIQLTLEPDSKFYSDPVVVLDFQSLYPSIMIAYNYCFSTCMGRLEHLAKAHEGQFEFGCTSLRQSPSVIRKLKDNVTISPNGCVFVHENIRKGIISAMVEEILNTRIMVKKSMKKYKNDKSLYRMLDARQLGLKLIANVTYGYTAANFSGRMPCIEIGDSIVRKGRESLERAIKLVEDTPRWGARVVYGDTDSLFIEMKGKSKDEAFVIGQEIADTVTNMFPKPMKLKFEKVYLPCVLQTKKRYVGFMYETPDQKEPVFDAKGIETVRRDNCGAVGKMLERCIKILFTNRDVSQVKQYVIRQCQKLLEGKVSLQDLVFAKEYRGMAGYKPGACVPALQIARKRIKIDPRSEPRTGERVPYIIVYGTPGLPLIQLVREPRDMIRDPTLRLNGTYYITKQILPPLNRLFSLLGVDVFTWYNEMPKVIRIVPQSVSGAETKKGTISQYFATSNCPVCDVQTKQSICKECMKDPQLVSVVLSSRIRQWEHVYNRLTQVCYSCMGSQDASQPCVSLDCPILFRRLLANQDLLRGDKLREDMNKMLDF